MTSILNIVSLLFKIVAKIGHVRLLASMAFGNICVICQAIINVIVKAHRSFFARGEEFSCAHNYSVARAVKPMKPIDQKFAPRCRRTGHYWYDRHL